MIAVEFLEQERDASSVRLSDQLLERSFLVGASPMVNLLRFYPALTIEEEEIDRLLETLSQILDAL